MSDKLIFKETYSSESLYDLGRDIGEAIDERFNDKMKDLPRMKDYPEFNRGEFVVTVVWKDNPEE
ncbi:MAG: hypothetical protein K0U38_01430 [Epsilonproteobacteria bacterium]|nr:hypothetical protein [Campylobacterota bacterium]